MCTAIRNNCCHIVLLAVFINKVLLSASFSGSTGIQTHDLERCLKLSPDNTTHDSTLDRCRPLMTSTEGLPNSSKEYDEYPRYIVSVTQDGVVVTPSSNIRGKVFVCECDKRRSIFVADSALLFTSDGFKTYQKILIDPKLIDAEGVVESIALTGSTIYLAVGGKVLVSKDLSRGLLNFTQAGLLMNTNDTVTVNNILGVSGPAICYRGNQNVELSSRVYAWDKYSVYEIPHDRPRLDLLTWLQLHGITHLDFRIIRVQVEANPEYLAVTSYFDNGVTIQRCSMRRINHECETLTTGMHANDSQVLASVKFDFLVWNERNVTMVGNNSLILHKFSETVDFVHLSHEKNSWLVKTSNGDLHYARVHSNKPEALNITLPAKSSVTFITDNRIGVIIYSADDITKINIFDLESLTTSIQIAPQFYPQILHSNVLLIGNALDSVMLQLAAVTTIDDSFDIIAYERFGGLPLVAAKSREMRTFRTSSNLVLRERKLTVKLSWNCSEIVDNCPTGFGLIELVYISNEKQIIEETLDHVRSEVYVLRATCPTGYHLRLNAHNVHEENCSQNESSCLIKMRKQEQLFLNFEFWQDRDFVSTVTDDVLLTELQNRTGFNYHDYNLLEKTCYQCSGFLARNSPSQLILQTIESACPCKVDYYTDSNKWIGNLSFANVYGSSNQILKFSAKVLSTSFCDLSTEFTVELLSDPDLVYHYLEYVSMLVVVVIVSCALCLSCYNYFKRTKDKQAFLSVTR